MISPDALDNAIDRLRLLSPYLTRLLALYPDMPRHIAEHGADAVLTRLLSFPDAHTTPEQVMKLLRMAKGQLALLTAIADIAELWALGQVTDALSRFAERSVNMTLDTLLLMAHQRGEIELPHPAQPSKDSGLIVLAMGKLGAHELNYSSDIDLMFFFERGKLGYKGRHNEQHFMNKLTHDAVNVLQERTADGYVFRTDLRLRPDPASMPSAISVDAAYNYYESVGQNWERAAMIKARPIAGDLTMGEIFLKNLRPFMWRRNLDFAAINDIHSIKRQMDSRQSRDIQVSGHNIKLGIGGIREIEFYVQIQQLIWGGRQPTLRVRGTCETLDRLVALKLAKPETSIILKDAYVFLRTLEHRLQMVLDEQTHEMPKTEEGITQIAQFMGYADTGEFKEDMLRHIRAVHTIHQSSFKGAEKLGGEGKLVFTGVLHDPDTLNTLKGMGYAKPETVSEIVMGWHHGSCRATRTKRARELLTELMPSLLKRLSETANPDAALLRFHEFLKTLPAGVQLFSLFNANPQLLSLIADIMGSAPTLSERLSKSPGLLDAVLYSDFYDSLPGPETLALQLKDMASLSQDFEDRLNSLRRFRHEKQFQAGVQLLRHMILAQDAGQFLSDLADLMIEETIRVVLEEFARTHGKIKSSSFAVIGLGKLGSRELTFGSDIDLIFVYDAPDDDILSDGEKSLNASVYYNRLAQRVLHGLSVMEREGRLYDVDTRLRPSGTKGVLAVSLSGLVQYFNESAWTFEYMAFTKARPVAGDKKLKEKLSAFIAQQIVKPRDPAKLKSDVMEMRTRVEKEFGTRNIWDIKYAKGGLLDIDFLAQYLLLLYAPDTPEAKPGASVDIFRWLEKMGKIPHATAKHCIESGLFLEQLFHMLRLCSDSDFNESNALPGLKKLLCDSMKLPDFETLSQRLISVEAQVHAEYTAVFTV
jgi:glutamate-ammonia-ligase adenylyltransferase